MTASNWDLEGNRYKLVRPLDQRCIICHEHSVRRCPVTCSSKLNMHFRGSALIYECNNSSVFLLARSCKPYIRLIIKATLIIQSLLRIIKNTKLNRKLLTPSSTSRLHTTITIHSFYYHLLNLMT